MKQIMVIPHLNIHNANALSSPFTVGFPAMTAWLGAAHALERFLRLETFSTFKIEGVGVVCHDLRVHRHKGVGDYVYSLIGTSNPLDKDGGRPAFVEEARCHLNVSLVFHYSGISGDQNAALSEAVINLLSGRMKIAGGDILIPDKGVRRQLNAPRFFVVDDDLSFKTFSRSLMPGYLLVERRELMQQAMLEGQDALSALLSFLVVQHRCENEESPQWSSRRQASGWLVPLAAGFQGISPLGKALSQRDEETLHRFAESVVTLGEFILPIRAKSLDDVLWHYQYEADRNLYLCTQGRIK